MYYIECSWLSARGSNLGAWCKQDSSTVESVKWATWMDPVW